MSKVIDPHPVRPGTSAALTARTIDATIHPPIVRAQEAVAAFIPRVTAPLSSISPPLVLEMLGLTVVLIWAARRARYRVGALVLSAMLMMTLTSFHPLVSAQDAPPASDLHRSAMEKELWRRLNAIVSTRADPAADVIGVSDEPASDVVGVSDEPEQPQVSEQPEPVDEVQPVDEAQPVQVDRSLMPDMMDRLPEIMPSEEQMREQGRLMYEREKMMREQERQIRAAVEEMSAQLRKAARRREGRVYRLLRDY
ncbi:MAG: hypothetical protein ACRENK_14250 [Gemmatimonadaceae bacterium]